MRSFNYALLFVLIQQNTVTFFSYSIRKYNAMTSEVRTKDNLWREIFGEILGLRVLKGIENIEIFVTVEI